MKSGPIIHVPNLVVPTMGPSINDNTHFLRFFTPPSPGHSFYLWNNVTFWQIPPPSKWVTSFMDHGWPSHKKVTIFKISKVIKNNFWHLKWLYILYFLFYTFSLVLKSRKSHIKRWGKWHFHNISAEIVDFFCSPSWCQISLSIFQ